MLCLTIITVFCILGSLHIAFAQNANTCTRIKIRKEIKSLTAPERQDFINALNRMKRSGVYDEFTSIHLAGMDYHGTLAFYPYHRALVNEFENEMLRNSEGFIQGLPYWDEGADFNGPLETPLFTSQYMGSVTVGQNQCLQAPFEGWMHGGECVARQVQGDRIVTNDNDLQSAWLVPAQTLAFGLSRISTFEEFAMLTERVPHDLTHIWVNGNMARADSSPADPIFWLHHNYVDFIWATWQRIRAENFFAFASDGTTLTPMTVRGFQYALEDTQNYNNRLCYEFQVTMSPRTAGRLAKRQAKTQPNKLPFLASLTDDEIKQISPKMKIEDYRKAEKALNNITTVINDLLQNGTPLSSLKTLSQMYQEGSTPATTNSAFALDSGSVGMIASALFGLLYSLF